MNVPRFLLVATLATSMSLIAEAARSQTVDPSFCSYDAVVAGTSTGAGVQGAGHSYVGYKVVVRDTQNQPIFGVDVHLTVTNNAIRLYTTQAGNTALTCASHDLMVYTDQFGVAIFTPAMGGSASSGFTLSAGGTTIHTGLPGRSTDMDADGKTDLSDFVLFTAAFNSGTNPPEADFNNDGSVGLADFSIFSGQYATGPHSLCP